MLISVGKNSMSAPHTSSDRVEVTGKRFAESFDEGSLLGGEMQAQGIDMTKLKQAIDVAKPVSSRTPGTTIALPSDAKRGTSVLVEVKAAVSPGVNTTGMPGALQSGRNITGEKLPDIRTKTLAGQPSSVNAQEITQKSIPESVDVANIDASEKNRVSSAAATPPAVMSVASNGVKPAIPDLKELLIPDKNQEPTPDKKLSQDHQATVKTEKVAKTEEKAVKAAEAVGNAVAFGVQCVVPVAAVALEVSGPQHGLSKMPDDDAISSVAPATKGRSVGMLPVGNGKVYNQSANSGVMNTDDMKKAIIAPLANGSSPSRKPGTDETKMATAKEKATDSDNSKTPGAMAKVTPVGLTGAEPRVLGAALAVGSGSAVASAVVFKPPSAHAISSGMPYQVSSGVIDASGLVDATRKTVLATPTSLEVGVVNGTHGWLKIRAEMTGSGVVNASLSTASSSGQEMLHKELSSLTDFLQSERVAVNSVVVQPTATSAVEQRTTFGGMNGDGLGETPQNNSQGGERRQNNANAVPDRRMADVPYRNVSLAGEDEILSLPAYADGGSWLSVRA